MLENDVLCDRIIEYFEQNGEAQAPGKTGTGRVDDSFKRSLDIYIRPKDLQRPEFEAFSESIEEFHAITQEHSINWP